MKDIIVSDKRLKYIDRLKGLAIVLVVMGHFSLQHSGAGNSFLFKVITSFHMPLFMFMSGYVLSIVPDWRKIGRKVFNWVMALLVFGWIHAFVCCGSFKIDNFFRAFTFLQGGIKAGYWYFWILSIFYISLGVCSIFNPFRRLDKDIMLMVCWWLLFIVCWYYDKTISDWLSLDYAVLFYPFFVLGFIARKVDFTNWLKRHNWFFTCCMIGYPALLYFEWPDVKIIESMVEHFIVPSMVIVVLLQLFVRRGEEDTVWERQLSYLGINTLSIYALHYFLLRHVNLAFFDARSRRY